MATSLTSTYTQVANKKMGDWGYGTLYLRLYAKYNSSNGIDIQARVYNNGTSCYSGNCYATVQGESVISNKSLSFTSKKEITLGTKTVSSGSVTAKATFKCYSLGSTTYSVSADVTLPSDIAKGLDFDIGSTTNITITRYNSDYTRTVVATIGSFSETLLEKGTDTLITWQPIASKLYEQVTNSNVGTIKLTTTTYNGNTVIGTSTTKFKCRVTNSNPVITSVVVNDTLDVLSGYTIRFLSNLSVTVNASGQNSATISSYEITPANSSTVTSNTQPVNIGIISNSGLTVKVIDSRGNSTTQSITIPNFVEYDLPTISLVELTRTGEELTNVEAYVKGLWYSDTLNAEQNKLTLTYQYRTQGSTTWSEAKTVVYEPTTSIIETTITLDETFDANTLYEVKFIATDNLTSGELISPPLPKAQELIDIWEDDSGTYLNFNAEIQQNGFRINGQKVLLNIAAYMNANQSYTLSEKISEQSNGIILVWCRYADGVAQDDSFNFTFVPKKFVELKNGYGVTSIIAGVPFSPMGCKYVYVSDDTITGNENNTSSGTKNGITYDNSKFVLRYVIGV